MISVIIIWSLAIVFFVLASLKRNKIKILPSILITLSIVFFALLIPHGRVLLTIGSFRITLDSLLLGLKRSGILVGMVFFSQFLISPKIKLPGKAGIFLKQVFFWLEMLTSIKISFKPGHIIESIDSRLCEIWLETPEEINLQTNVRSENGYSDV